MRKALVWWSRPRTEGVATHPRLTGGALLALATVAAALAPGGRAAAQTDTARTEAALMAAAQGIEPAALARHLGVLTADSLAARATPSRGLELAAQYVADQFQQLGLAPGAYDPATGQETAWFQRYPVPGHLRLKATSRLRFVLRLSAMNATHTMPVDEGNMEVVPKQFLSFADAVRPADTVFRYRPSPAPDGVVAFGDWSMRFPLEPPTVLVAGQPSAAALGRAELRGKLVLHVPAAGADAAAQQQLLATLKTLARGLVILQEEDSASFAQRPTAVRLVDSYVRDTSAPFGWAVYVRPATLGGLLEQVGVDVPRLRAATAPAIRPLPALGLIDLLPEVDTVQTPTTMAMNTVGLLPGTDAALARQYLIFSAHLDRGGPGAADAHDNHDNAAGVAGLLELARAFSRPGARPRRTLVFLATSGGAQADVWGSTVYATTEMSFSRYKLNLTLDRLGRPVGNARGGAVRGDTVTVAGLQDVELGSSSPVWVAAAHPELGLTVEDGGPVTTPSSDHFAFVKQAIPSLYLHAGAPAAGRGGAVPPGPADAEYVARVFRLVFYMSAGLANATPAPRWTAAGRQHLAQLSKTEGTDD